MGGGVGRGWGMQGGLGGSVSVAQSEWSRQPRCGHRWGQGLPCCHPDRDRQQGWGPRVPRCQFPTTGLVPVAKSFNPLPPLCLLLGRNQGSSGLSGNEVAGSQPLLEGLLLPYGETIASSLASFLGGLGGWG